MKIPLTAECKFEPKDEHMRTFELSMPWPHEMIREEDREQFLTMVWHVARTAFQKELK